MNLQFKQWTNLVNGVNINLMTFSQVLGSKAVEWHNKKEILN